MIFLKKILVKMLKNFGYYSILHKDNKLKSVSFNYIIYNKFNFNLIFEKNEQKIMFDWLENDLSKIEKNNELIH